MKQAVVAMLCAGMISSMAVSEIHGADTQNFDYTGNYSAVLKNKSASNKTYTSKTSDQNTALANNGTVTLDSVKLIKTGSDNDGDATNFYGVNSNVLAVGSSAKAYIKNSAIVSNSTGTNGVFATNKGTVYLNNSTIKTVTGDNARGLDATYGGTIIANKMTISTEGAHSAALATDRGGGTISVTNSKLSTKGSGSPLIYSTGTIEVDHVSGTSSTSQIAGMEGKNVILINNSKLTSTSDQTSGSDPVKNGVIIYQSTSGDADTSSSTVAHFQAVDSTLSSSITSGSMFYLTNTSANVILKNTTLNFNSNKVNLLQVEGNNANSWGTAGSNGASVNFTMINQKATGNISVDTISSANVYVTSSSTYKGKTSITTNSVNTNKTDAPITMNVDKTSTWVVTGNSTLANLNVEDGAKIVDTDGKTVTIKVNGVTKVQGTSSYVINVTGTYSTTVKLTNNNSLKTATSRKDFDQYFNTTTTYGTNSGSQGSSISTSGISIPTDTNKNYSSSNTSSSTNTPYMIIGALLLSLMVYIINIIVFRK